MSSDTSRNQLPEIETSVPGTASLALAGRLARVESRNVTFRSPDSPIFWTRAAGSNVWDADGNRYVDLTAGFGVAAVGQAHPRVLRAVRDQAVRLQHGMGDVHPPEVKVRLLEALADRAPYSDPRIVLGVTGSEAVEIALKTACLSTGKPGALAFRGAYHGLGYGALGVTDRALFRAPFETQLNPHTVWAEYPDPYRPSERLLEAAARGGYSPGMAARDMEPGRLVDAALELAAELLDSEAGERVGAVIVEPVQGRGGEIVPPPGFLTGLLDLCRERGLLLICDEIFTGFGRTGDWFAVEADGVRPDLLCCGKALAGGLPIGAVLGRVGLMDAWRGNHEALHTATFVANPLSCAAALAVLEILERQRLPERAADLGRVIAMRTEGWSELFEPVVEVRGLGLAWGIGLASSDAAHSLLDLMLNDGILALAGGPQGCVVQICPPLVITDRQLAFALASIETRLEAV